MIADWQRRLVAARTIDGKRVSPIVSIAGEDTGFSLLKQDLAAIAIVFDFMNPVLPLGRLIDRGSKLWLDEPEPCRKH